MLSDFSVLAAATQVEPDLLYIWSQATNETKGILIFLGVMSIIAWSVMVYKVTQMYRARKLNRVFQEEFKRQSDVLDIFNRNVKVEGCPLFNIYRDACAEINHRLRVIPPAQPVTPDPMSVPPPPPPAAPVIPAMPNVNMPGTFPQGTVQTMPQAAGQPGLYSQPVIPGQPVPPVQPVLQPQPVSQIPVQQQPVTCRLSIKTIEHIKGNIERTVAEECLRLESGLIWLAIAVSGSPFIGLLGTVWGVMSAFSYVGAKGSADLATMAPGVAGALIATVGGLAVAIPSMFFYNWLVHNLRAFTVEMDNFAQELSSKIETEFLSDD
jgi:biopolymer transport protein ExbB/TolQ